ncbi:MAG: ABC transporter permease [Mycoplasmatales bacterium]
MNSMVLVLIFGTLSLAAPLIAAAYGGMFSERSGVVNIGLEGMMTAGAFGCAGAISFLGDTGLYGHYVVLIGILVGCLFGFLFGLLHAWLSITYKVDQIISGTIINIAALAIFVYSTKIIFKQANTPMIMSSPITFFHGKLTLISLSILFLSVFFYYLLFKTKWGTHVLSVGENPSAADAMGINVAKVRYQAVLLSGTLGGLGGAAIVLNTTSNFSGVTVAGSGFIALAVLIFGRHNPFGVVLAGIIFGFFKNLGIIIQTMDPSLLPKFIRFLSDVPQVAYQMLPYVITIIVLVIFSRGNRMSMEALGTPYDKEVR